MSINKKSLNLKFQKYFDTKEVKKNFYFYIFSFPFLIVSFLFFFAALDGFTIEPTDTSGMTNRVLYFLIIPSNLIFLSSIVISLLLVIYSMFKKRRQTTWQIYLSLAFALINSAWFIVYFLGMFIYPFKYLSIPVIDWSANNFIALFSHIVFPVFLVGLFWKIMFNFKKDLSIVKIINPKNMIFISIFIWFFYHAWGMAFSLAGFELKNIIFQFLMPGYQGSRLTGIFAFTASLLIMLPSFIFFSILIINRHNAWLYPDYVKVNIFNIDWTNKRK